MSGFESTIGTGRRWPIWPAVLLALVVMLVVARTGRSTSNATGDGGEPANTSELAPRTSPMAGTRTGPTTGSTSSLEDVEAAPAVLRLEGRVVDPEDHAVGGARVTLGGGRVVASES